MLIDLVLLPLPGFAALYYRHVEKEDIAKLKIVAADLSSKVWLFIFLCPSCL